MRAAKLMLALVAFSLVPSFVGTAQPQKTKKPNIVVILADDMGYSDISCYGGEIKTPNLDKLAGKGLRFTNMFNTARCCPTHASLMTGLYPHQAGMGWMTSEDTKRPGYRGQINRSCVTIAEVLRAVGYFCMMVGKWHLTFQANMDAPHDSWPLQRGFHRYFGTLTGAGSYYQPSHLTRDNERIKAPEKGFYYTDAISDNAVTFLREHRQKEKNQPFFLYVAYTSPHWPLHALKDDIDKYRDVYKKGWDVLRQERHERMKKLGIVDPNWQASARDKQVPPWDSLKPAQQEEQALKMAVYAAQIDRMDQGIGRIVAQLKDQGDLDDTLLLFMSDNGGCEEGGLYGFERKAGGKVGEDSSFASYGRGWAWLSNTIFRLFKHWVHAGGVSTPLIAHWPNQIRESGLRKQHGHVIDIMATCIDVAGAEYPKEFKGNKITPLEGKSLVPALANRPIEREAIYWEHEAHKAVLAGKWKLVAQHPGGWELYDFEADRSETRNLAAQQPERVKEMAAKWQKWAEARDVLPLIPRGTGKAKETLSKEKRFTLQVGDDLPRAQAPNLVGRPFTIEMEITQFAPDGVLVAQGGKTNGFSLYLKDGKLQFAMRHQEKQTLMATREKLQQAASVGAILAKDGTLILRVDGKEVINGKTPGPLTQMPGEGLQVGADLNTAVGEYSVPFRYGGKIGKVVLELGE